VVALQQRDVMNSNLDRGSVAVVALQQRDVMNSNLDRGSVAVVALQQRDVMNSNTGACTAHGGGRRCQEEGCLKSARGDTGAL
jgi:hypothetical protein